MPQEIERRFLVEEFDPGAISSLTPQHLIQGYLELPSPFQQLRIRIINGQKALVGRKTGEGLQRGEEEWEVSLEAAQLLMRSAWHVIEKLRYKKEGWELDLFKGPLAGLVLAEYEMQSAQQKISLPPWITKAQEVTDSLSNLHLARLCTDLRGLPTVSLPLVISHTMRYIPKIVLTGGPCSGKSGLMEVLREEFGETIHCVPEVATIVISQVGIRPPKGDLLARNRFNEAVFRTQEIFERTSTEQAAAIGAKALVLDRGSLDIAAYMPGGIKEYRARFGGISAYDLYHLVLCLEVSPRDVYEKMKANNPARTETYEEASALGERTKQVWSSHPKFTLIPNGKGWDHKKNHALRVIRKFLAQLQA